MRTWRRECTLRSPTSETNMRRFFRYMRTATKPLSFGTKAYLWYFGVLAVVRW